MKTDMIVELSEGTVVFREVKAKYRNEALKKSITIKDGKAIPDMIQFLVELLPLCIASHPWGNVPVRTALGDLHYTTYDKLTKKMQELLGGDTAEDDKKKLEPQSEAKQESKTQE